MKGILILSIVQSLLMTVGSHSQEKCEKEPDSSYYYIYNTTVRVKTYRCTIVHNIQQGNNLNINQQIYYNYINICRILICASPVWTTVNACGDNFNNIFYIVLYESSKYVKLLGNDINFVASGYDAAYWIDARNRIFVWYPQCQNLHLVSNYIFNVWKARNDKNKYITNEHMSLKLLKNQTMCGTEVWTTNYEDLVASKYPIRDTLTGTAIHLNSSFHEECEMETTSNHFVNSPQKFEVTNTTNTWHVYVYSLNVSVYYCMDQIESCTHGYDILTIKNESNSLLEKCSKLFCNNSTCVKNQNPYKAVCKITHEVDLKDDTVKDLNYCKYSDGICKSVKAFWGTDTYGNLTSLYENYTIVCNDKYCQISKNGHITDMLNLVEKGKHCGQHFWFTNKSGVIVSQLKLQPELKPDFNENKSKEYLNIPMDESEKINELQTLMYYTVIVVLLCIFFYLFNIMVNFSSLWALRKLRNSKMYLLNCVSQSLTIRYLYLNLKTTEKTNVELPPLEVSVQNEIYIKTS